MLQKYEIFLNIKCFCAFFRQINRYALLVFLFLFLKGDALVEGLGAIVAFREEVEADGADVLLGTEILEVVHLVALDLELHHAPVLQAHAVAIAKMLVDECGKVPKDALDGAGREGWRTSHEFLDEFITFNGLVVHGDSLVFSECWKRWLGFFFDSVFHKA